MGKLKVFPDIEKLNRATIPSEEEMAKLIKQWNEPSRFLEGFTPYKPSKKKAQRKR